MIKTILNIFSLLAFLTLSSCYSLDEEYIKSKKSAAARERINASQNSNQNHGF